MLYNDFWIAFRVAPSFFNGISFVIVFWLFASVLIGYRQIKQRNDAEIRVKFTSFSLDISLIAVVFAAISLVLLSYIQVFASAPMSGIVGGDVLDYMVAATRFSWSDFAGWSPYVWSNNFYLLVSNLAGLPMHFVYVGLQFYLIIPIAAFYFLVRTIFPENKKTAAIATLLCFFVAGVASWLLLKSNVDYNNFLDYTGFPGITPLALSPWILDYGFLFFALAFVYRGIFKKERDLVNYILPAVFTVASFFSHNLNIILIFVFSLIIFALLLNESRRYVLKLSLLTLVLVLALDPLSKWMFIDNIFAVVVRLKQQLNLSLPSTYLLLIVVIAVGIAGLFMLSYAIKKNLRCLNSWSFNLVERAKISFSNNRSKLLFYAGGFIFFGIAVFLYLCYPVFKYSSSNLEISPDWFIWIIFRSFGIILPFAIASIPFLIRQKRNSLLFTSVVMIAVFVSVALSISLSQIIPPYVGYVRYPSYLVIPLSIFASLCIVHSTQHFKVRRFKALFVIILVVLASTSVLSQAYARERFYDLGQTSVISTDANSSYTAPYTSNDTSAINWINNSTNIQKGSVILPLFPDSEEILSNLALDVKVTPNFQTWYLKDVLSNSSSEVILNCLNTLGIDYIFVGSRDSLDDSNFNSLIQSFKNQTFDQAVIFRVPSNYWPLPYFDSLFQKITFSLFEQYTGLTPINNKIIWFSNVSATGDIQVNSKSILISEEGLSVSSMNITTNSSSIYYEDKLLSNVSMMGPGELFSGPTQSIILRNASGLNTYVDLSESQNVSLTLLGADIQFKIGSSNLSFNNANVSITLKSSNSLVALCNQPLVTVNGFVKGSALGLIQGQTFDHDYMTEIAGKFIIEFPYSDNLIYSQIIKANELVI